MTLLPDVLICLALSGLLGAITYGLASLDNKRRKH